MIRIVPILILLLFTQTSCDYIDGYFKKEPLRIDFTCVDTYPVFPECDSIATQGYVETCFEKTASMYIETELLLHEFSKPLSFSEALIIHLKVDREGVASFQSIESIIKQKKINPEIEAAVKQGISNFPKLIPAKKRGNSVESIYMIPLYIVIEEAL